MKDRDFLLVSGMMIVNTCAMQSVIELRCSKRTCDDTIITSNSASVYIVTHKYIDLTPLLELGLCTGQTKKVWFYVLYCSCYTMIPPR